MWRIKEFGKSHDSVQRSTYFIAHIHEEGVFHLFGFLCLHRLLVQPFFGFHEFADVSAEAEVVAYLTIVGLHGYSIEFVIDIFPVFVPFSCLKSYLKLTDFRSVHA